MELTDDNAKQNILDWKRQDSGIVASIDSGNIASIDSGNLTSLESNNTNYEDNPGASQTIKTGHETPTDGHLSSADPFIDGGYYSLQTDGPTPGRQDWSNFEKSAAEPTTVEACDEYLVQHSQVTSVEQFPGIGPVTGDRTGETHLLRTTSPSAITKDKLSHDPGRSADVDFSYDLNESIELAVIESSDLLQLAERKITAASRSTPHDELCQLVLQDLLHDHVYVSPADDVEALQELIREEDYSLFELEEYALLRDDDDAIDILTDQAPTPTVSSTLEDELMHSYVSILQAANQCHQQSCPDQRCSLGQQMLNEILSYCKHDCLSYASCCGPCNDKISSATIHLNLQALMLHASRRECPESCSVPWCFFFAELEPDDDAIPLFKAEFSSLSLHLELRDEKFQLLTSDLDLAQTPAEGVDYMLVSRDYFRRTYRAVTSLLSGGGSEGRYGVQDWCIKKVTFPSQDQVDRMVDIVTVMSKLQHAAVVAQVWIVQMDHVLCSAALYSGSTVRQFFEQHDELTAAQINKLMNQICDVLKFLSSCRIMYLNWSDEHVILSCRSHGTMQLMLCNFMHSVHVQDMNDLDDATEDVINSLCPRIQPPELLTPMPRLHFPASDWWGAGCLGYQLLTGESLHWSLRHEHGEKLRDKLGKYYQHQKDKFFNQIAKFRHKFYFCEMLEINPECRRLLEYLK